jgi:LacI family transcriptional regulator
MARINLRDVARAAGVSVAAVSLAMNGKRGLSEGQRAHILEVAQRLGYAPDAEMVKLMAHVANRRKREVKDTLAVISDIPRMTAGGVNCYFWDAAKQRAGDLGYGLEEFLVGEMGLSPKRLQGVLAARGIDGAIISITPLGEEGMHFEFDFTGLAVVMAGFCFSSPALHYVRTDHFQCASLAMEKIYEHGYRRPLIALVGGADRRSEHQVEGAYLYFIAHHPEMERLPVYIGDGYERTPLEAVIERERPDVVLCTSGGWAQEIGRQRIPGEFGWVGLGWSPANAPMAAVDGRLDTQARFVVDMLVAQLHRGESGVPVERKEMLCHGRWVEGPTLPYRRANGTANGTEIDNRQ